MLRWMVVLFLLSNCDSTAADLPVGDDSTLPASTAAPDSADERSNTETIRHHRQALDLLLERGGEADSLVAEARSTLGTAYATTGLYQEARPHLEQALAEAEKLFGPDHPLIAKTLIQLAQTFDKIGGAPPPLPLLERAVTISERVYPAGHPEIGKALLALGIHCQRRPAAYSTTNLLERALTILEQAYGPKNADVAAAKRCLGWASVWAGDYSRARTLLDEALLVEEELLGPQHPRVASTLHYLSGLYFFETNLAKAREAAERALAIREQAFGPDHPAVLVSLQGLGGIADAQGDLDRAQSVLERALLTEERLYGADATVHTVNVLGEVLVKRGEVEINAGRPDRAKPIFDRAASLLERAIRADSRVDSNSCSLSWRLETYGRVLSTAGNKEKSLDTFRRALEIRDACMGDHHPSLSSVLLGYALVLRDSGRREEAFDVALRCEKMAREHVQLTARTMAEQEALQYSLSRRRQVGLLLGIAADGINAERISEAWDVVIRSRCLVLDEMASRHRTVGRSESADIRGLATRLDSTRAALATAIASQRDERGVEEYRGHIEALVQAKEELERRLAERSVSFREEWGREHAGSAEVAAALAEGEVLVSFVRYDEGERVAHARYLAIVFSRGQGGPQIIPLGDAATIEARVEEWRSRAAEPAFGPSRPRIESACAEAGRSLRETVWDPIAPQLVGAKQIYLVPDGSLHLVDFGALPKSDGRFVIEESPLLVYLTSERDLIRQESETPIPSLHGLLAFGGPNFESQPAAINAGLASVEPLVFGDGTTYRGRSADCESFRSLRFTPLPHAGHEVLELADIWKSVSATPPRVLAASGSAIDVILRTGEQATEAAFKQLAPGSSSIHLATHAFVLGRSCALGADSSETNEGPVHRRDLAQIVGENPLLLSGVALAGANRRGDSDPEQPEEDGILTAEEIATLNLTSVDWIVLSGCNTGGGSVESGEGVFGLRRAFAIAGAGTVILSVWSVDDLMTRHWMRELYEARFNQGLAPASAVRAASLARLDDQRARGQSTQPCYWAGFIASGRLDD